MSNHYDESSSEESTSEEERARAEEERDYQRRRMECLEEIKKADEKREALRKIKKHMKEGSKEADENWSALLAIGFPIWFWWYVVFRDGSDWFGEGVSWNDQSLGELVFTAVAMIVTSSMWWAMTQRLLVELIAPMMPHNRPETPWHEHMGCQSLGCLGIFALYILYIGWLNGFS